MYQLRQKKIIQEAIPEKPYLEPRSGLCDIWFKKDGLEVWLELQTIVTNYGTPGKPITNQVSHVIGDAEKLKEKSINGAAHILFMVYPLECDGQSDYYWEKHMSKINHYIKLLLPPFEFKIKERFCCRIYAGEVKQ